MENTETKTVRRAEERDLPVIREIYACARQRMRESGNPDQWGETYPPEEIIRQDLAGGNLYVILEGAVICGVFAFFREPDPDYAVIDGAWLNDHPYGAIHRIAGAPGSRGILESCVSFCRGFFSDLRIDTHRDNRIMQAALTKQGFVRCGIVQVRGAGERIA